MSKINFFILSTEKYQHRKKIIKHTWGKDENIIFFSDGEDAETVKCSDKNDYFSASEKTINVFQKIKNNELTKFGFNLNENSWNVFCDDDTFINTTNLKKFVKNLDENFVYGKQVYEKQYFCECDLHKSSTKGSLIELGYKKVIALMGGAGFLVSAKMLQKIEKLPYDLLDLDVHGDYVAAAIFEKNQITVRDELLFCQEHYSFFQDSNNVKLPYTKLQKFNEIIEKNISFHRNCFEDMIYLNNYKSGNESKLISLPSQIDHKHNFHIFEEYLEGSNYLKRLSKKLAIIFVYKTIKLFYKFKIDLFGFKNFISSFRISQLFDPVFFKVLDPNQYICVSHSHTIIFKSIKSIELDHFTYVILKRIVSLNLKRTNFNCSSNNFFYSDIDKIFKLRFNKKWFKKFKEQLKINRNIDLDEDILLKQRLLIIN